MISNWVPNPIKCFLLSVIGQNRPSPVSIQETPAAHSCIVQGDAHATGKNVIFFSAAFRDREREREREMESRWQHFLFLARQAFVYVRFFLRPDGARPYYPNSPTRTPSTIIIMWRRRATESKSGGMERECMCERDLMCHPSLPALCRLHFIIICA